MSTNRIQRFIAVGLTVTVSLLLVLAVQVGSTRAATGTSGASSTRALQGAVEIHLRGPGLGRGHHVNAERQRFTISGAISDRGRWVVNDSQGGVGLGVFILFGAKGTIRINVGRFEGWRITKGTGAYAGLHGRGRGQHVGGFHFWMSGTVSQ